MKNIKIMSVIFDTPLDHPREISAFRGAVIQKVGIEHSLYHNHDNTNSELDYHYRYPLVQYKMNRKKPSLIFIDQGIEEAQHFFTQPNWNLNFAGRKYRTNIEKLVVKEYQLGLTQDWHTYTVRRWMALNQKNFSKYLELETMVDQITFLEKLLAAHIISLCKKLGYWFDDYMHVSILKLLNERTIPFGDVKVKVFDVRFKTNMLIPSWLGIGKSPSLGFGTVSKVINKPSRTFFEI